MIFSITISTYSYVNRNVMSLATDSCCFCDGDEPEPVEPGKLGQRGYDTLLRTARDARCSLPPRCVVGAAYHNKCKKRKQRQMEGETGKHSQEKKPRLVFCFRTKCLFCAVKIAHFTNIEMKTVEFLHPRYRDSCSYVESGSAFEKTFSRNLQGERRVHILIK